MRKTLIFIMCLFISSSARADMYRYDSSTDPGELCWMVYWGYEEDGSEPTGEPDEYFPDFMNYKCNMASSYIDGVAASVSKCESGYLADEPTESCYLIKNVEYCVNTADYNPCDFCRKNGDDNYYYAWSVKNSNNAVSRKYDTFVNGDGICSVSTTAQYEYGCPAGYYLVSGSGSSTVCAACPSNATCSSSVGHRDYFVCNKGYYASGSACVRCPSSGGIYGTTLGTGAKSITECYMPAGTVFTDTTGSGVFVGDCYYSE